MKAQLARLLAHIPHIGFPHIGFPHIGFLWPGLLWALLLIPLAVALYILILSRRRKSALRFANVAMVKEVLGRVGWRRHVPPLLMLAALALLLIAIARPTAILTLPSSRATVMLAMDVSGSMRATDAKPTRLAAAQAAAKQYIKSQPGDVSIGIVAFAATAFLVQSPTTDHAALGQAVDRFELQRGTAVGSGILVALSTLFPHDDFPISSFDGGYGERNRGGFGGRFNRFRGRALGERSAEAPKKPHVKVAPGSYKNAVIILLTDGQTNAGYDPVRAANIASQYGVKVYTVGFGTTRGSIVKFGGFSMRTQLDDKALKKIADTTLGRYFHAGSAQELKQVYGLLSRELVMETRQMEISSFFAAAAALLMLAAAGLSLRWFSRVV
ncbi:MAG: VWA domain-containing protein [Rhizomicrobium sp.]